MDSIFPALRQGLPILAEQFGVTLLLLALGIVVYRAITPFNERELIRNGNVAAGIVLAGTIVAFAIPLGQTLASSEFTLDIVVWGLVAVVVQLATFAFASFSFRGLLGMIEAGNVAVALVVVGIQIAVAIVNAGAMAG